MNQLITLLKNKTVLWSLLIAVLSVLIDELKGNKL